MIEGLPPYCPGRRLQPILPLGSVGDAPELIILFNENFLIGSDRFNENEAPRGAPHALKVDVVSGP